MATNSVLPILQSGVILELEDADRMANQFLQYLSGEPMTYSVVIEESDEGCAVSVPGLPGCHSQGATEAEAMVNIADAIREYLSVAAELARSSGAKQALVEV